MTAPCFYCMKYHFLPTLYLYTYYVVLVKKSF
jgi:hypothetical protein